MLKHFSNGYPWRYTFSCVLYNYCDCHFHFFCVCVRVCVLVRARTSSYIGKLEIPFTETDCQFKEIHNRFIHIFPIDVYHSIGLFFTQRAFPRVFRVTAALRPYFARQSGNKS